MDRIRGVVRRSLSGFFLGISILFAIFAFSMKICVFCSANNQIDSEFFALTEELDKWAAEHGHSIVYGGVNQGLNLIGTD